MSTIERETGQFPVSIGTSLAIEGLLGIHPNQPQQPSGHRRVNHVWINIRTVVRNFVASMSSAQTKKLDINDAVLMLSQELDALQAVFNLDTKQKYNLTIYCVPDLELKWAFPNASFKKPNTERQRFIANLEEILLKGVLVEAEDKRFPILFLKKDPPNSPDHVAILTHYPHELLWRFLFETMFLLESHTGKLKSYSQWYTKLQGLKESKQIPFNRFTLQIFGDGTLFEPAPKKMRDEIFQIAELRKWSIVTSIEKIRDDIIRLAGEELRKLAAQLW